MSLIYQICLGEATSHPVRSDIREYYARTLKGDKREEAICRLMDILPKGMFTRCGNCLTYNGGFKEWWEKYKAEVVKRATSIEDFNYKAARCRIRFHTEDGEDNEFIDRVEKLYEFIECPFGTDFKFFNRNYGKQKMGSYEFMCYMSTFSEGESIYIGSVIDIGENAEE